MAIPSQAVRAAIGNLGAEIFSEMSSTSWEIAAVASIHEFGITVGYHPGAARSRNEDRAIVADVTSPSCDPFRVAIVCDGVGGSEMGDAAAALAVATFISEMANLRDRGPLELRVKASIRRADDVVRAECKGRGATTLSVLAATRTGECVAANVGDSRIFSWRAKEGQFEQVSVDDTFENEMRDLNVADQSVLYAHGLRGSLSQAVGEAGRRSEDLQIRTIGAERLTAGAILATDGAWRGQESVFNSIAMHTESAKVVVNRVVSLALWTGGSDNISIIAIENLDAFAKEGTPGTSTPAESRVSLWTGGKKATICLNPGRDSSTLHEDTRSVHGGAPSIPVKKRLRRTKRRVRKAETEQHEHDPREVGRAARPHIEVSTDDTAT